MTLALQLKDKVRGQIYADEPMCRHTSFHIGGPADVLV
ncbi:MAG: UDP-N-acetylenolpyruvoylglucosamine reductase, partial [Firmicutes bacterium]|nr:UDP-N-acetylenolpyruvoylglucosamine reductase [Bacillota bacterium]